MSEEQEMDEPTLRALALGVEPVAPPADLRDRILAGAREGAEVVPLRRELPRRSRFRLPVGMAAAIAVVALGAGILVGQSIGHGTPAPAAQTTHFTLQGHGPLASVTASAVDLKSEGVAVVTFSGLPELPPGQVYEVWLITSGNRADAAGVFTPGPNGDAVFAVRKSLSGYSLMAVTIEAGPSGVSAPTQQPQIYGTVT
jgi:anti-sigma-K factor RskA